MRRPSTSPTRPSAECDKWRRALSPSLWKRFLRPGVSSSGGTSPSAPSLGECRRTRHGGVPLYRGLRIFQSPRSRSGNVGKMARLIDHQDSALPRSRVATRSRHESGSVAARRSRHFSKKPRSASRVLDQRTLAKLEVLSILGPPDETVPPCRRADL
jgi:hypothetical protein